MNITKDVIIDLYPLYAERECSSDTRALVEAYLQRNPQDAEELRQTMGAKLPATPPSARNLEEMKSFREARRRVRSRAVLMGLAIFFSLCPFSVFTDGKRTHWLLLDSPGAACIYGGIGMVLWIAYIIMRKRANALKSL
jgi:ferric-dicitrate binding protein FerR (iron transport regulator)